MAKQYADIYIVVISGICQICPLQKIFIVYVVYKQCAKWMTHFNIFLIYFCKVTKKSRSKYKTPTAHVFL